MAATAISEDRALNISSRMGATTNKYVSFGQGKCATAVIADQGDLVTFVTDVPYKIRSRHIPFTYGRGARPMHQTTLHLPTQSYTDYLTTSKQYLGGISRPERSKKYGSQHVSQLSFGDDPPEWKSSYGNNFIEREVQPPAKIHLPSFENRMNMSEGAGLKRVMTVPGEQNTSQFWTQYNRVHNKLGAILGPGVPHEKPVRRQYNPLNGEDAGEAWRPDNKRISGNRILYNKYRKNAREQLLG